MENVSVNLTLTPILTSSILFSLGPHLPDVPQQCLFISLSSIWLTKLGTMARNPRFNHKIIPESSGNQRMQGELIVKS